MIEQEARTIEQICLEEGGFNLELLGNVYCEIGLFKKISCIYQSENKDHNKIYTCLNPVYQSLRLELDKEYKC